MPRYRTEQITNEYGSQYGVKYIVKLQPGQSFLEVQSELIRDVIGEDYYYGSRDVWDQIVITQE